MLVMQGKRNLNQSLCFRLSEVLKHTRKEAEYFQSIVNFMQADTGKEKDLYFNRMAALRKNINVNKIEESQYEYYSNWYNPVIRELATQPDFDGDSAKLAKTLLPVITPSQAKKSIQLLLKLGFIKRQGKRYIQSAPLIATEPEVNSLAVLNFHRNMGNLSVEALDRIPKKERNITSSTLHVTQAEFETICKKIEDFRKELLALADSCKQGERVYQINFQVFPVSKKKENRL